MLLYSLLAWTYLLTLLYSLMIDAEMTMTDGIDSRAYLMNVLAYGASSM